MKLTHRPREYFYTVSDIEHKQYGSGRCRSLGDALEVAVRTLASSSVKFDELTIFESEGSHGSSVSQSLLRAKRHGAGVLIEQHEEGKK